MGGERPSSRVGGERRYMVRFRPSQGDVAELPYHANERVQAGDLINVCGWRVWIETVVEDAREQTSGLLTGRLLRATPALGQTRSIGG